jgi:predicted flap endonuclease-1-like 5' DNA nuclease
MLAALAVGILIGWLLRRWFGGEGKLKDVRAELEAKNVRYAELSSELGESKLQVESLNRDLESRAEELTEATDRVGQLERGVSTAGEELEAANARAGELEAGLAAAQEQLDSATARAGELEAQIGSVAAEKDAEIARLGSSVAGIAALESSVAERDARITELESEASGLKSNLEATASELTEVRTSHAACAVTAENSLGRIAGLETVIAERDERIADLEERAAAASAPPGATDFVAAAGRSADLEGLAALEEEGEMSVSVPLTTFGTAGADHTDDLKVINGIGPKMEELLNGFGIRAWDQLAALSSDEVTRVDEALEEFPGRIERDQWVEQARDLIRRFPDPRRRPDRATYLNESPS